MLDRLRRGMSAALKAPKSGRCTKVGQIINFKPRSRTPRRLGPRGATLSVYPALLAVRPSILGPWLRWRHRGPPEDNLHRTDSARIAAASWLWRWPWLRRRLRLNRLASTNQR